MEIERARDWYAERSQVAAVAFVRELTTAIDSLAEAPDTWSDYSTKYRRRVLSRFPFSVIYRVTGDTLQVIAVAHDKKRPGYWRYAALVRKLTRASSRREVVGVARLDIDASSDVREGRRIPRRSCTSR